MPCAALGALFKMENNNSSAHSVRLMKEKDIPQVSMIENDAFPNLFPPTSFRKELQRPISTLMVAISQLNPHKHQGISNNRTTERNIQVSSYRSGNTGWKPGMEFLTGFIFLWKMSTEETHVMSIGTRRSHRRKGIGELLLHSAIAKSIHEKVNSFTLEVRVSNTPAIALYEKYELTHRGSRKSYYTDNHEDASIMTVDNLQSADYRLLMKKNLLLLLKRLKN